MKAWIRIEHQALGAALMAVLLAMLLFPLRAAAQTPAPTGVYLSASSTGEPGGDRTLLALTEEGSATMAFISMDEAISNIYRGVWLLDPYGTVTVELKVEAAESCSGEEGMGTVTFMPSQDANVLTAVHYPQCLWGDGGLTLVRAADETIAAIEAAYANAGLMPGLVFLSNPLVAADGTERQLTLNLGQNAQAMMITQATDGAATVEVGDWSTTLFTVTVTLTGTAETTYDEPDVLAFGYLKDNSGRMVAYTYDREKYGDQGVIMTYSPELVDMVAVAMDETAATTTTATAPAIPGVYTSDLLPAADAPGLVQTLALFDNGNTQNTLNYLNGEAPTVELGTWIDNEDGTATVEITGTTDEEYAEPTVITYTVTEGQLEADDGVLHKLPSTEPPVTSAPENETVSEPVAYYESATLPAASSPGREIALSLFGDSTAVMHTDYLNDEAPIEEIGIWETAAEVITVTLTGRPDQAYDEAVTIVFADEGDQLVAVEYDAALYGEEGLVLYAQPFPAAATNE